MSIFLSLTIGGNMLFGCLSKVEDFRRSQGRSFDLGGLLMIAILAVISGANSYDDIAVFCKTHLRILRKTFGLQWWKSPSRSQFHSVLSRIDATELEKAFREYSSLISAQLPEKHEYLSCDGKALRGSFDHMQDRKAAQILSIFASDGQIILAHALVDEKTNEIPVFQTLIKEIGLTGKLYTLDALHAQKNSKISN